MNARNSFLVLGFDLAGGNLEGGEQGRGAVALVVVAVPGQRAPVRQLQVALRPLQRLDRGLLVDADDNGLVGRRHVETNDIGGLGGELRVLALAPAFAAAQIDPLLAQGAPDILNVDVAKRLRNQRSVPAREALGRRLIEHRSNALVGRLAINRRRAAARQIVEASQPFARKASPPEADRGGGRIELTRDLTRRCALGCLQHDLDPQQHSLLGGCGAKPSLERRTLLRLEPNLDCIGYHRDVES
jgi:hypothetical protein